MARKIILTGVAGLLGHEVAEAVLRRGDEVLCLYREHAPVPRKRLRAVQCPMHEASAVQAAVLDYFPDAVIHMAAVSEISTCAANPDLARLLNVELTRELARLSHHLGARFIYVSTEQVFDGSAAPYAPKDAPNAPHLYGQTKAEAEQVVLKAAPETGCTVRLPLLTGNSPSGKRGVHERLLAALAQGERPVLWEDVYRQPTSNINAAAALVELTERPGLVGLYHWGGPEAVSRAELGRLILKHFGLPETLCAYGPCETAGVARDLRLDMPVLPAKLRTVPETLARQIAQLEVPAHLAAWVAQASGQAVPLPRLRKGIDF